MPIIWRKRATRNSGETTSRGILDAHSATQYRVVPTSAVWRESADVSVHSPRHVGTHPRDFCGNARFQHSRTGGPERDETRCARTHPCPDAAHTVWARGDRHTQRYRRKICTKNNRNPLNFIRQCLKTRARDRSNTGRSQMNISALARNEAYYVWGLRRCNR